MRSIPMRAVLLLLLGACASGPSDPDGWRRLPGRFEPALSSVQALVAPARVGVGETFSVTVNTVGSSTCTRAAGEEVRVEGLTATIVPYDLEAPAGTPCTRDLRRFPHEASLRFDRAGEARLVVRGRDLEGRDAEMEIRITVLP